MAEDEKRFIGIWGTFDKKALSHYPATVKQITMEDVTTDNGYEQQDIDAVNALERHQVWHDPVGGNHYIIRIK